MDVSLRKFNSKDIFLFREGKDKLHAICFSFSSIYSSYSEKERNQFVKELFSSLRGDEGGDEGKIAKIIGKNILFIKGDKHRTIWAGDDEGMKDTIIIFEERDSYYPGAILENDQIYSFVVDLTYILSRS